jgi:hypothetical protein
VRREDILAYVTGWGKPEVIVDPDRLLAQRPDRLPSGPT